MKAIFLGRSEWTDVRIECAVRCGCDVRVIEACSDLNLAGAQSERLVVFIAAAADELLPTAESAVRALSHVYLDADSVAPLADARQLVDRAREAGVQLSGTRPLLFDEQIEELLEVGPARLLSVTLSLEGGGNWRRSLQVAADLAGTLCGTFASRRIDVEVARDSGGLPVMALLSIRFLNGALAHVRIGPERSDVRAGQIIAATDSCVRSMESHPRVGLVRRETDAFLSALQSDSSAPVGLQRVIDSSALVEEILRRLRQ